MTNQPYESQDVNRTSGAKAAQADAPWQPGDRVSLVLPDKSLPWGRAVRVFGTVTEVDRPGIMRGVFVQLDRFINGIDTCHASHAELRREA